MAAVGALPSYSVGALIYVVILGLWAAYLVPMALRRHDELSESRSVDRFSTAMRILSRRTPTTDRRYVVMPRRESPSVPTVDGADDRPTREPRRAARPARPAPSVTVSDGRARLVARRRRVLGGLLALTVLLALAASLSPLPWWCALVPGLLAVAFLAHLRGQARRERELRRRRRSAHERVTGRSRRIDSAERVVAARRLRELERTQAERAASEAAALVEQAQERRRAGDWTEGWAPIPVTLPTYVTKPKAGPVARIVDLTRPGRWTKDEPASSFVDDDALGLHDDANQFDDVATELRAGRRAFPGSAGSQVPYDDRAQDGVVDPEIEAILERRRAVND